MRVYAVRILYIVCCDTLLSCISSPFLLEWELLLLQEDAGPSHELHMPGRYYP